MHWRFVHTTSAALVIAAFGAGAAITVGQGQQSSHLVPFFPAASTTEPQGFLRIVNNSDEAGAVTIVAIDDAGSESDALSLEIGANETASLDAGALEAGDQDRSLSGSTGAGQGDWRLRLTSDLAIEPQSFARTPDGALWEMRETASAPAVPKDAGAVDHYRIATVNPGSNLSQVGRLRLVNPGEETVAVTISGTDDAGTSPGSGVRLEIPPGEASTYTAAELESGVAPGLEGALGDGEGKWRLDIETTSPVLAMSLLSSPTGHLTNLSTIPAQATGRVHRVLLFPPVSDPHGRQGFARVVNRSDAAGEVRIEAFDDTPWTYDPVTLALDARETRQFNSHDLELGNEDKGLTGGTGAGEGDWRLELTSDLDIAVLSYVRTVGGQGYVIPMHDTASRESGGLMRYYVPVFHAAAYDGQESRLHLANFGAGDAQVGISALDDAGRTAPEGDVSLIVAGRNTRVLTAAQLEGGDGGLDGRLGTGTGSWRLFVTVEGELQVMSLGYSADGYLANLSRGRPPARTTTVSQPDLVVEEPSVSDSEPDAGGTFTLSATVTNRGDGDAEATTLRYYRSANAALTATDVEIGRDAVDALSAGGSIGESITVTARSKAGTYYYGACVDALAEESDTANNCSPAVPVTVPAPPGQPDLVVVSPSVSDSQLAVGEAFTLSATVHNRGEGASVATTLRYYRSDDASVSTSDIPVGTDAVAALAAQNSSGESIDLTAPSDAGTYYYAACVDAVADESDTANNCSSSVSITVPDAITGIPDLVVESPSVSEGMAAPGTDLEFSATVRNIGSGDAQATRVNYYRSTEAAFTTVRVVIGSDPVGALAAAASSSHSFTITAPSAEDTYYFRACVDPVTDEPNTANNCSTSVAIIVANAVKFGAYSVERVSAACDVNQAWTHFATDKNTGQEALDAAVKACTDAGGLASVCSDLSGTFRQCAAAVFGISNQDPSDCTMYIAPAATQAEAESIALTGCQQNSNWACTEKGWACNMPRSP